MADQLSHITSITIDRDARFVFEYMRSPENLQNWSFGTWETDISPDGLICGKSLFDGSSAWVRISADNDSLVVDYHIGQTPQNLVPRIMVRVVPGSHLGFEPQRSVLTFIAWRACDMDDLRWRKLTASHELEIVLLKSLIENSN